MSIASSLRILADQYWRPTLRNTYWELSALARDVGVLASGKFAGTRQRLWSDCREYLGGRTKPSEVATAVRAQAAVDWLLRAQAATPDDGVSLGYFPADGMYSGWRPSYPETTGYIMTSLFRFARVFEVPAARDAAVRMAAWEVAVQMPSGAVQGGPVAAPSQQTPSAFNTGMVLDGWCSAFQETGDPVFLEAGRQAAEFLVDDLDDQGYFKTNGAYVSSGEIKTYTCLCAWALHRFGALAGEPRFKTAAARSVMAALCQQTGNGWFAHNCLTNSAAPLTHTIGYTLQGVLEVGLLSDRQDFVAAARRGLDPILEHIKEDGYLPGQFYPDWAPASLSSCLTGSAQIAIVCFRLAQHTGQAAYAEKANLLVNYLKSRQDLNCPNPGITGALAGSFPIFGSYMRAGYPNWATKYFLDALLLQHEWHARSSSAPLRSPAPTPTVP